jgi:DNA-binding CsgD family transcriptional regulator
LGRQPMGFTRGHALSKLILLSRGKAEAALEAAEYAAIGFEAGGFPFDRGRSLLVAGEVLRRGGERRRAAEKFEQARIIFADLGAALWLDRTIRELSLANPRPRNDRDLTRAERAVAELVALGHTNREVAAQLFIKVPTVEAHLTRIYRKVGIRSRTQLARRVAEGDLPLGAESS